MGVSNITFNGFTPHDFATFSVPGLEARMEAIRQRIQPKFQALGTTMSAFASDLSGHPMYLHIAKHARRKTNAPIDTWLAIGPNKRGYKQLPHFQIGLFDDHLFIWLALIYELPNKVNIADTLLANMDMLERTLPSQYVISGDHQKKDAVTWEAVGKQGLKEQLIRFRNVKKAEWLIGQHIKADDPLLQNGALLESFAKQTFEVLMPVYQLVEGMTSFSRE